MAMLPSLVAQAVPLFVLLVAVRSYPGVMHGGAAAIEIATGGRSADRPPTRTVRLLPSTQVDDQPQAFPARFQPPATGV
jgi:hypothetical protein